MDKVYIITSGEYSDYRIRVVFSDKEIAQQYVNMMNSKSSDILEIEEWEVSDNNGNIFLNQKLHYYDVHMTYYGDYAKASLLPIDYDPEKDVRGGLPRIGHPDKVPYYCSNGKTCGYYNQIVQAQDEIHAIKIVNEKRAKTIAMEVSN